MGNKVANPLKKYRRNRMLKRGVVRCGLALTIELGFSVSVWAC